MEDILDFVKCPDLRYVVLEQDFGPKMFRILQETKICSAKQLMEKQGKLEAILSTTNDEKKGRRLKELINIARYFKEARDEGIPIAKAFTETKFLAFVKNQEKSTK